MKLIDSLIPRPIVYLAAALLALGFIRSGGLAAAVDQLNAALGSLAKPMEELATTVGLLALIAGVILHFITPHAKLHGHGRQLIAAAVVGTLMLGAGVALLPHIPDLGGQLGNAGYQALVGALR